MAAIMTLALVACGSNAGTGPQAGSGDSQTLTKVRLTALPIANMASVQLAIDNGYFEDEGLDVEVSYATSGAAVVPGVLNGSVDVGYSTLLAQIAARSEGLPLVSIATSDGQSADEGSTSATADSAAVIVRSDSGFDSAADLNGKTIAINALSGLFYMITRGSADNLGGDSATYKFAEIPFPDMIGALQDGRIDAAAIAEPFLTTAVDSGDFKVAFLVGSVGGEHPGLIYNTYFTSEQTLASKPEVVEGFHAAISKANAFARDNPDAARTAIGKFTEIDQEILAKIDLPVWTDEPLSVSNYDTIVDLMTEYGLLADDAEVPAYGDMIHKW